MKDLKVSNYNVLTEEKKNRMRNEILNSDEFKSLIPILDSNDLSTIEHVGGYSLELEQEREQGELIKGIITSNEFATPNKNVRLFFTTGESKGGNKQNVTALIVKEQEGQKMLEIFEKNHAEDLKLVSLLSLTGDVEEKYEKGILISKERFINEETEETITVQAPWDGCMPGGYFWCGRGCGYQTGSTLIKNKIDGCCLNHDYCYTQYSTNRCTNCDNALVSCVQYPTNRIQDPTTADYIKTWFNFVC